MSIRLIGGDCREVLATLPANSVHCVVSSPPYFGLRDYGTAQWAGGDAACDHARPVRPQRDNSGGLVNNRLDTRGTQAWSDATAQAQYSQTCGKCGATRVDRQIGLEASPDLYLAEMVAVFREVRRVLRPDGTCWVNMGDSFSSGNGTRSNNNGTGASSLKSDGRAEASRLHSLSLTKTIGMELPRVEHGLAPKQLLMMPARLALALQADGWWLRSQIVWAKPNPMPESVTDRPTSSYEMVYLLAKAARYFYDADAVREPHEEPGRVQVNAGARPRSLVRAFVAGDERGYNPAGRSCRNVWTIATAPYSEAHFATFPPALAERCIRAGTSERGCCAACGAPWARVVERTAMVLDRSERTHPMGRTRTSGTMIEPPTSTTTGWAPSCACDADVVPATVLDPFAGAGTTLLVADRLQRDAIGIELNPDYTRMAMDRCRDDAPLFAEPSPPPAEAPEEPRIRDLFA